MHSQKDAASRRRTNAPTHGDIALTRDDETRGPDLETMTGRDDWSPAVVAWYAVWQDSPQAQAFESTDWMRLAILAPIMEGYFKRPSAAALSEIRMNEERLGATVVDRMRARMKIEARADDGPAAPVVSIVQTRADIASRLSP
jgi:hypothetical protein